MKINIQSNHTSLLPVENSSILQAAGMINSLKVVLLLKPVTVLFVHVDQSTERHLLNSLETPGVKVKQKKALLSDRSLREQLKELLRSVAEEERRVHFDHGSNFIQDFFRKLRTKSSLLKIKKKIDELARKINAPQKLRPSYGPFDYDADSYFIEIDKRGVMRLIETEKGQVHEVRRTRDMDELLYWIFTNITFSMACSYAMENPTGDRDRRKLVFLKQEELLGLLYSHWKDKKHAEYREFFNNHPKDEISGEGPEYCNGLRKQIHVDTVENSASYFRFPQG